MAKETICSEDELASGNHGYEDHRSVTRIKYTNQTNKRAERTDRAKDPRKQTNERKTTKKS